MVWDLVRCRGAKKKWFLNQGNFSFCIKGDLQTFDKGVN